MGKSEVGKEVCFYRGIGFFLVGVFGRFMECILGLFTGVINKGFLFFWFYF